MKFITDILHRVEDYPTVVRTSTLSTRFRNVYRHTGMIILTTDTVYPCIDQLLHDQINHYIGVTLRAIHLHGPSIKAMVTEDLGVVTTNRFREALRSYHRNACFMTIAYRDFQEQGWEEPLGDAILGYLPPPIRM